MNKNAPYIREIVERTKQVDGTRIVGKTKEEIQKNAMLVLQQQLKQSNQNVRTQTY
ncbi:hypothetical protein QAY95_07980 [Glaesserella parasuis]|uniref:hypothetical protein n=1 Tax=Glaesserella parasuis TaxID=738 RepID=UPI002436E222|nr:hypothetical protein [Glaesserella parasuis]MDG6431224.1 hypothetical protein [Glaesserella parasuis]MDP0099146.1 hypothetical protein [Glaesserella parasuis]MDP0309555.1 hypothetical protein [Glaesserella parasuis]MDP0320408.1 hypothetical protein [Glaesserella parasuis]